MAINNSQEQNKEIREGKVRCLLCKEKSKVKVHKGQKIKNSHKGVILTHKEKTSFIVKCPNCGKQEGLRLTKKL